MDLNRTVGYAFGGVYVLVGLLGFTVSGGTGFAAPDGGLLLGIFEVNVLHNLVHIAVGALLAVGAATGRAVLVNTLVGAVYLLVGVFGLVVPADSGANILAINAADNGLHFASALLLLGVGLSGRRQTVAA